MVLEPGLLLSSQAIYIYLYILKIFAFIIYCLQPYDEDYLKEKDIKHMSFHAYVRKLTAGHGKGTQLKKPLENIVCTLKTNCPGHKPYPKGICTKCRPPSLTLNRQVCFTYQVSCSKN